MLTTNVPSIVETARLSVTQSAKALGVSPSSIDRWTREGLLRCHYHRHNSHRYWLGADLLRFWKSQA